MIAVILAAGVSSRLRPLTNDIPKCLLQVGRVPLLQRTLEALHRNHIKECVVVTGFQKQKIEDFVHGISLPLLVSFVENPLYATTSNTYSLWTARKHVGGRDMLLMDADILFDSRLIQRIAHSHHDNSLIIRSTRQLGSEEIKVQLDGSNIVRRIGKDVNPKDAAGESIGIERFSGSTVRTLFEILDRRKEKNEFYEASFQEMIDNGTSIHAIDSAGLPCMEIDTPDDYTAANELALTIP